MLFRCIFSLIILKLTGSLAVSANIVAHQRVKRRNDFSKCGTSSYRPPKIVGISGGDNSNLGDWAWMAALYYSSDYDPVPKPKCGGSLISKEWVVTAAHCIDSEITLTKVRLGDLNLNDSVPDNATPIDAPVAEVIVHPKFTAQPLSNDIALIRLNYSVNFTEHVHPVCVSNGKNEKLKGADFYRNRVPFVTGYGKPKHLGVVSTALQGAQVEIVDIAQCAKYYKGYNAVIDDRVLCAGNYGRDSCQGSSGGPLVSPTGGSWYLIGIVSYGVGCGDSNYPGVYTKVAHYSDWISNATGLEIELLKL